MNQILAPLEAELVKQDRKHLEMIVLFVTHYINHLVNGIIGKTEFSCADVLRHVNRCAVTTEKQLMVQPFSSQVSPHRAVFLLEEETFLQSFHHFLFSFKIGVGFIIYLVEADTHLLVGFIETGIYPVVHHLPQSAYFRVTCFPLHKHFTGFLHQWGSSFRFRLRLFIIHSLCCISSHQFLNFRLIMLIERYIIITYQMVAFLAGSLRSFTVAVFLPCQHGFTDMDATVVNDIGLYHLVAVCSHNVSQCVTQKVVTHVSQVKRLVRIRRRIFNHHQRRSFGSFYQTILFVSLNLIQQLNPRS